MMENLKTIISKAIDTANFYKNKSGDKATLKFGYVRVIEEIAKANNYINSLQSVWTSVEDEKPQIEVCCDVWVKLPNGEEGRVENQFFNGEFWFTAGYEKHSPLDNKHVTHWMPLPGAPEVKHD